MRSHRLRLAVIGLAFGWLSGCATLSFPWGKEKFPKASASNPVVQIVCLWEQAEGRDPDGLPCRGFAGQILFLSNRHATPVEIEGDVRIYLFDNVGSADEQSKPLRQYDFTTEAWKLHLTKSAVGPSYSVFVPYVRRGQHNAQCSLRLRLTPKSGPMIFSQLSTLPLRGPNTVPDEEPAAPTNSIEERVQTEVTQALSKAMQKTKTISLSVSNSGGLSVAPNALPEAVSAKPIAEQNVADDRLTRMEKLLEHVLAEKAQASYSTAAPTGVQQVNYETMSPEPVKESESPRRFKLNRSEESE